MAFDERFQRDHVDLKFLQVACKAGLGSSVTCAQVDRVRALVTVT